jgi:hypothetical protein
MADAEDLKSSGDFSSCGFDSHPGHQFFSLIQKELNAPLSPCTCRVPYDGLGMGSDSALLRVDRVPRRASRNPQIYGSVGDKLAADDAENQKRLVVESDCGADDFGVAGETLFPQTVTQHGNETAIWAIFCSGESASGNGASAEQSEVSAGDMRAEYLLGMLSASEVLSGSAPIVSGHLLEDLGLLLSDVVLGDARDRNSSLIAGGHWLYQSLWIGIGEGLEGRGIHHRKHCGIHAYAGGNNEECDRSESGCSGKRTRAEAQVLPTSFQEGFPAAGADDFFRTLETPHSSRTARRASLRLIPSFIFSSAAMS